MAFDPDTAPRPQPRAVPWWSVAVAAGVGLVGLVVALAVLAPVLVLGGLLWLALLGVAAWRLALHTWERGSQVPPRPEPAVVEALAEAHRAAARERHARTVAVVSARLVGPGFARRG